MRPSTSCYGRFSLPMASSSGFGSTPGDMRAVHTRFRCGSGCDCLNRPPRVTRRIILQKARRQPVLAHLGLRLHVSRRFQGLFHSPRRGAFHLSLTVLVHYRSLQVFSLGRWSSRFPTGFHVPRGTHESGRRLSSFAYRTVTLCGGPFQWPSARR